MRVLFVAPYYEPAFVYGGPSRSIPALCRALAGHGLDLTVFTTNANGGARLEMPTDRPVEVGGVRVRYFPRWTKGRFFWSPALARACFRETADFDLVHINGIFVFPSLVAADAAHARSIPYGLSPRGMLMPWALGYKGWKKALYMRLVERRRINRAAAIICTDEAEREALQGQNLGPPAYVVPNGLDTEQYLELPPRGAMREAFGIPASARVIIALGRLHPVKRPDLAAQAFGRIASTMRGVHLVFAGPDELGLEPRLRSLVQPTGCADRVHFTGLLSPKMVRQALADADLLMMASESENFGMAVAEAMAAGLPVLVSDRIGISRLVTEAGCGIVSPLSAQDLAEGLMQLLQQPDNLPEMGRRARQAAVDRFDLAVVAQQMMAVYAEILERDG